MNASQNQCRYYYALLIFVFISISGCQNIVHFVAYAGDDGLVWPLPPAQARLRYFESFDLVSGQSTAIQVLTGQEVIPPILFQPSRIVVKNSTIVTIDRERGTVHVYKEHSSQSFMLRTKDGQHLQGVLDVALDHLGRIYVAEGLLTRISIYDENGIYLKSFGSNLMWIQPESLIKRKDGDKMRVTDSFRSAVLISIYDKNNIFKKSFSSDLMWMKPERIAVDPTADRIYIADSFRSAILVFSSEGVYLFKFGEHGSAIGEFDGLINLSVDNKGNLWTLDAGNKRIQQFNARGIPISSFNLPPGIGSGPIAFTLEPDGTIYIADQYQEAIHIFRSDGELITQIGSLGRQPGKFNGLSDIWFDSQTHRLYTAEINSRRIQVFSRTETPWSPYP